MADHLKKTIEFTIIDVIALRKTSTTVDAVIRFKEIIP